MKASRLAQTPIAKEKNLFNFSLSRSKSVVSRNQLQESKGHQTGTHEIRHLVLGLLFPGKGGTATSLVNLLQFHNLQ